MEERTGTGAHGDGERCACYWEGKSVAEEALRSTAADLAGNVAEAEIANAALVDENRVLRERALRFREIAEMVKDAFYRDSEAAVKAFGSNAVGHMAREALISPSSAPSEGCDGDCIDPRCRGTEAPAPPKIGHRFVPCDGRLCRTKDLCHRSDCACPESEHEPAQEGK